MFILRQRLSIRLFGSSWRYFSIMSRYKQLKIPDLHSFKNKEEHDEKEAKETHNQNSKLKRIHSVNTYRRILSNPVPDAARQAVFPSIEANRSSSLKFSRVCFAGLPNAGKSSLLNRLLGGIPVSAVSKKVNTTKTPLEGVLTEGDTQLVFTDLPGIVASHQKSFSKDLVRASWSGIIEADIILLVIDATKKIDPILLEVVKRLTNASPERLQGNVFSEEITCSENSFEKTTPVILVLNKIDLVKDDTIHTPVSLREKLLCQFGKFEKIYRLSANPLNRTLAKDICETPIEELKQYLIEKAQTGSWMYDKSIVTSISDVAKVEQQVWSYLLNHLHGDIPYTIRQNTIGWTELPGNRLRIDHDSGILRKVVGCGGSNVKAMEQYVSKQLQRLNKQATPKPYNSVEVRIYIRAERLTMRDAEKKSA